MAGVRLVGKIFTAESDRSVVRRMSIDILIDRRADKRLKGEKERGKTRRKVDSRQKREEG